MTLEFANKEAQRRTDILKTVHYVIHSVGYPGEYMVTTVIAPGYEDRVIAEYKP